MMWAAQSILALTETLGLGLENVNKELALSAANQDRASVRENFHPGAASALAATELLENVQRDIICSSEDAETAYIWGQEQDKFSWEANAGDVLSMRNVATITDRHEYELLIAPEHVARRQQIFSTTYGEDLGNGVPYNVRYRFAPAGLRSQKAIWLEEQGRWWAGDTGKPSRARGRVRVISESDLLNDSSAPCSDYDELTGQLNRIRLTQALATVISRAENSLGSSALLVAAVSNLAVINETFGYDVGDQVLARVAGVLGGKLRGGDSIGRYSSNKFGIVLNDCEPSAMRVAADRLIKAVSETTFEGNSCPISATLSVGGVLLPDHASTVNEALSRGLEALNVARERRVSCFEAHVLNTEKESARRRNMFVAEEVRVALDENRMHLDLQPIVDSKTRKPAFYECLMRMTKPNGMIVSAGEFIEVAEQLGFAKQIDRRTLALAADYLKADPDLRLSLNVSGLTCADHDWLLDLYNLIGCRRELAERLIVEITETATIHDLDQSIVFVDTVKEMGCRVAIDDFGAGYSSFKTLKHLPVDMVKIDGGFIRNLTTDKTDRVFLRTMVELAENFGMETVAEYVIDGPTADIVEQAGITYLQGFHLGRPMEAKDVLNKGK
ncbi:MAG: diguanylate cyclase (GGDEF)-like protein [Hyphomicrobiaceae bacterium]|jgi:diguanylate cyclase (GGDEF)-like protein